MNEEYKTLRELDAQPGDVVEWKSGTKYTIFGWEDGECYSRADDGSREPGDLAADQKGWRIVSRATDTPKLWRDMTDADGWRVCSYDDWQHLDLTKFEAKEIPGLDAFAYRVRPEPKRETVTVYAGRDMQWWEADKRTRDTHRITFDLIDGKPDCNSIKMEPM